MKSYGSVTYRAARPLQYRSDKWLDNVAADYKGPWRPPSLLGTSNIFSLVEDSTGWVEIYGVPNKDHAAKI